MFAYVVLCVCVCVCVCSCFFVVACLHLFARFVYALVRLCLLVCLCLFVCLGLLACLQLLLVRRWPWLFVFARVCLSLLVFACVCLCFPVSGCVCVRLLVFPGVCLCYLCLLVSAHVCLRPLLCASVRCLFSGERRPFWMNLESINPDSCQCSCPNCVSTQFGVASYLRAARTRQGAQSSVCHLLTLTFTRLVPCCNDQNNCCVNFGVPSCLGLLYSSGLCSKAWSWTWVVKYPEYL